MTNWRKRVDGNQEPITKDIRASGLATVQHLSMVGRGIPDLMVGIPINNPDLGIKGINLLFELKVNEKDAAKLIARIQAGDPFAKEEYEARWLNQWQGHADVVHSSDQIISLIKRIRSQLK